MKKFLAIVLVLTCIFGLCACAGGGSGAGGGKGDNVTADGKVKLSIGLPVDAFVLDHKKNALTRWVEETCNVELTFVEYSGGTDVPTQISTAISGRRELPDILFGISLGDSVIARYGKDGYFRDLSKYFEDKDGASKTFWDRMENELTEKDRDTILRIITNPTTGAIYGVPIVETSLIDKMAFQMWVNKEWLDKLNLEVPTNNEELVTVLRAFKDQDPDGDGKNNQIPLFGNQNTTTGGRVVDFLVNTFMYYNFARKWNLTDDGTVVPAFTQNEYREALKFINSLYAEGLLSNMVFTGDDQQAKQIITPSNGKAMVGMFAGHLTLHTSANNNVLEQYVPMQTWGNVVRKDISCALKTFITDSCENPDKAFEVLMALWSWEGSMRVRYGEYKVNWTDPTPGAKSDLGLDATYKLLNDPLGQQNTAKWSAISSCLNVYAEGETAEIGEDSTPWLRMRSAKHAESYKLFLEVETNKNPKNTCPVIVTTQEEKDATSEIRTNIDSYAGRCLTDFVTGKLDPNSDADWNKYLNDLNDMKLDTYVKYVQTAIDRS